MAKMGTRYLRISYSTLFTVAIILGRIVYVHATADTQLAMPNLTDQCKVLRTWALKQLFLEHTVVAVTTTKGHFMPSVYMKKYYGTHGSATYSSPNTEPTYGRGFSWNHNVGQLPSARTVVSRGQKVNIDSIIEDFEGSSFCSDKSAINLMPAQKLSGHKWPKQEFTTTFSVSSQKQPAFFKDLPNKCLDHDAPIKGAPIKDLQICPDYEPG